MTMPSEGAPQGGNSSTTTWTAPATGGGAGGTSITFPNGGNGGAPAEPRQFFTAEDIEKARREERDKLYGRISKSDERFKTLEEEVSALRESAAQRALAEQQLREREADVERQRQQEEMSAKQLIEQRENEWQDKFSRFQREQEISRAAYERDKQHLALANFIERRAREEIAGDHIADELIDFISGNTEEEVEASILALREKTQRILNGIREGQAQLRAGMPGVSPSGQPPRGGPMDNLQDPGQRQLTPEDIRNIPMSEWHKYRGSLGLTGNDSNQGLY